MVAITIASFLLFQTPSGVLYIWDAINGSRNRLSWFYTATYVSNLLVIVGKTLNFIIYCVSSKNFRQQLLEMLLTTRVTKRRDFYAKKASSSQAMRMLVEKTLTSKTEDTDGTTKYGLAKDSLVNAGIPS
uniref:G_PROTEIN_RECEP_F1_2 domain-containing protein n=1 Tax=Trichuris muris TaxID=70415 RepID=A0A5S6QU48_TRIMR